MFDDEVNGEEKGKTSSCNQLLQNDVGYAPETPAKPGRPDPEMVCKNLLQSQIDEVVIEETSVNNYGSTSQTSEVNSEWYDNFAVDEVAKWNGVSFREMLALANPTGKTFFDQTQTVAEPLCDLNLPPKTVAEPSLGLSLQFTPLTPDPSKRGEDKRMNLAGENDVSILVEGNQEFEKGLAEQTNLSETRQTKQRRRKHRPKVVTEGKPKRVRKHAMPNPPDGSSTGKRKYVRRKGVEKSPATPGVDEASGTINPNLDQETKKRCKRKIDFDEEVRVMVDNTSTMSSEVVGNYQKVQEAESLSPITPSKTELPYGRVERNYTKAKCKINFLQETHDKVQIHVPTPNESSCSTSVYNKGYEAQRLKGGSSGDTDAIKLLHDRNVGTYHDSLESYLSIYTDYSSVCHQYTQSYAINNKKGTAPAGRIDMWSNNRYMQTCGQNFKRNKLTVYDSVLFDGRMPGGYRPQHTYMQSHVAAFHVGMPNKYSMVTPMYHDRLGYNQNFRCQFIYDINALINQFERMHISKGCHEKNALVVYQHDRSIVPYVKKQKHRPKVDLDDETNRVWMLLLEDINSEGIDGTDEDKAKWWEEERRVFRGRADSFIARMHLVQGDRRFSQWKGSVLDSVVGVYLTQNVSDHLSSSAFMSLAARYPLNQNASSEPLHESEKHDPIPMMLQEADSCQQKEAVNSDEFSKNCVISESSECEVAESSEKDSSVYNVSVTNHIKIDETVSSHSSVNAYTMHKSEQQKDGFKATAGGYTSFVELSHMQEPTRVDERKDIQKHNEKCASEESGISVELASQTTIETVNTISSQSQTMIETVNTISSQSQTTTETVNTISSQESANSNCMTQQIFETQNFSTETSKARENSSLEFISRETVQKVVDFHLNENVSNCINNGVVNGNSNIGKEKVGKKETEVEWDNLRLEAEAKQKRERTPYAMDSMDYEAIRAADVKDVADAIKERGMNNRLAERIKGMLDRLVKDHGSMDLEWLRDVPPDKAKEYLLSFRGLGLKSVECIRLLTLHHLAFPVDTNVGRIAVRLGWVPLQALPESLQLHLLELYPIQESIQKYLWPRLCKLDQKTLYELHYQMITFGKVFCTKTKPNCNACPLRGECRHFASAFASARLALPAPEENTANSKENRTVQNLMGMIDLPSATEQAKQAEVQNCNLVIKEPTTSGPIVEEPTTPGPIVEVPATPGPIVEMPASPEPEQIQEICDIEDFSGNTKEIPMIKLNIEEFTQNLQTYMEKHMELGEGDMSKALVALTSEAASIPTPKLKNINQLRTEHQVYELPESHPLLEGLDRLEPDDPCSYLLAIWTPGETADSIQPPEGQCCSQESGILCNEETCFFCNSTREANSQTVRGTILIPCRTAMRGSFPLNGTYFQVNEVFADHESSLNPIDVPRAWLWNLPRRTVYFGSSIPTIFKGLTTEEIQLCFWRGFVCVRGFDRNKRAPRPLRARLHIPASRLKSQPKTPEKEKLMQ